MDGSRPTVVILAGPNGAGKSTAAAVLLPALGIEVFINADNIARDLSPDDVDAAAIAAGRAMLGRLRELAEQRASFAFETTLASRSFAPWLRGITSTGYAFHLAFSWLASEELAIRRVADRVSLGGHNVPPETIRRRYRKGLTNFFDLYEPLTSSWAFYDNSTHEPRLVAERLELESPRIYDRLTWALVRQRGQQ